MSLKIKFLCSFCGKTHKLIIQNVSNTYIINHESISCNISQTYCLTKQEWFETFSQFNENLISIGDEYRKKHNLLTSSQLINIRKSLKLNYDEFATLITKSPFNTKNIKYSNVEIKSYENGKIQDEYYNDIIIKFYDCGE